MRHTPGVTVRLAEVGDAEQLARMEQSVARNQR